MSLVLSELAEQLRLLGLHRTPPIVLLTRWQALIGDDQPIYFHATHDAGSDVPGSRYTFVALSEVAVCYLSAEHDDEMWEHDRYVSRTSDEITPRSLVAWRRPLRDVREIGLGGSAWDWLADQDVTRAVNPTFRLRVGTDYVDIPLPSKRRQGPSPDLAPVGTALRGIWAR